MALTDGWTAAQKAAGSRQTNELGLGGQGVSAPGYVFKGSVSSPAAAGGGGGGGGGGQGSGWVDPRVAQEAAQKADLLASLANQEQAFRGQLGRLGSTHRIGAANIQDAFNLGSNRLNQQKGVANRNYTTNTEDVTRGYQSSRNEVASGVRARMNALQQLLGSAGSGNSSAAQEAAPFAAQREGSQRLAPVQATYSTNRRNLDTEWQDTLRDYANNMQDLKIQRVQQRRKLAASVAQTKADLLDKIMQIGVQRSQANGQNMEQALAGQADNRRSINSLLDSIVRLGRQYENPILKTGNIAFDTPDLGDYQLDELGDVTLGEPAPEEANFLPGLVGEDEEELIGQV